MAAAACFKFRRCTVRDRTPVPVTSDWRAPAAAAVTVTRTEVEPIVICNQAPRMGRALGGPTGLPRRRRPSLPRDSPPHIRAYEYPDNTSTESCAKDRISAAGSAGRPHSRLGAPPRRPWCSPPTRTAAHMRSGQQPDLSESRAAASS